MLLVKKSVLSSEEKTTQHWFRTFEYCPQIPKIFYDFIIFDDFSI